MSSQGIDESVYVCLSSWSRDRNLRVGYITLCQTMVTATGMMQLEKQTVDNELQNMLKPAAEFFHSGSQYTPPPHHGVFTCHGPKNMCAPTTMGLAEKILRTL